MVRLIVRTILVVFLLLVTMRVESTRVHMMEWRR